MNKSLKFSGTKFLSKIALISLLCLAPWVSCDAQNWLTGVKRIVFLGNSITYNGKYIEDIEAYLLARYPQQRFELINLGLPSETVSGLSEDGHANGRFPRPDLHERLARVLAQTKPDLVFACYGINDGIYQPFDEGRFQKFKDGINWLHLEIVKTGAKIIHVTPPVYDELKGGKKGYADVMDRYAKWLIARRKIQNWMVADLHFPMKTYLEEKRKQDPEFALSKDGIHPAEQGHWLMAKSILLFLGGKKVAKANDIESALPPKVDKEALIKLVAQKQSLMKDAWLTATGHKRPQMKPGIPLEEAKPREAGIQQQIDELLKRMPK